MEDDFYNPEMPAHPGVRIQQLLFTPNVLLALFLGPILVIFLTRYLSERSVNSIYGKSGGRVWMPPHWVPFVGHGFEFLLDPIKLMSELRDQSMHGIFALYLGGTTNNIISDPGLLKSAMSQRESVLQFRPIVWPIMTRFFGVPNSSRNKYDNCWDELHSLFSYFMKESQLKVTLANSNRLLEQAIPQMVSFVDTEIDLQPWERCAKAYATSSDEMELDLCPMLRDLVSYTSVPAIFGSALLEKYPDTLQNIYALDDGMYYLLAGLPAFTPWPACFKAHLARTKLWDALDDQQRALDALAEGESVDYSWGNLDDVSEFIMKRNEIYRKHGFEVRERGELSVLWALVVNSSLLVFWQLIYIFATPGLPEKLRQEVLPFVKVFQGESIGNISEGPKMALNHEGLSKYCPHLKSTYFEALRLTSKPWSVRKVADDVKIYQDRNKEDAPSYILRKGEYLTLPHELHMRDAMYYQDPDSFVPDRFLVTAEDGTVSANIGTTRPFGGGPSMCKGRVLAEREILSMVAGILTFWDIEPADEKKGWVVPKQVSMSAVSKPKEATRVKIKKRTLV